MHIRQPSIENNHRVRFQFSLLYVDCMVCDDVSRRDWLTVENAAHRMFGWV